MMHHWGMGWGGMWFGPLFMIGLLVCWVVLIAAMIRSLDNSRERPGVHLRTSREILDEHLAKGEIDRNEYFERSKTFDLSAATL